MISPTKTGTHAVLLRFDPGVFATESTTKHSFAKDSLRVTEQSIEGRVEVVTSLGLTSFVDSLFRVIGAIAGFVGVVLSYPLWKRLGPRCSRLTE